MSELKYSKELLIDCKKEELELLKEKEQALLNNGEILLEAILNVPFKNKQKFDDLKTKINIHKENISIIETSIKDLEPPKSLNGVTLTGNWTLGSNSVQPYPYQVYSNVKIEHTKIKFVDIHNEIQECEVIDDIFQSVLGDYYMQSDTGSIAPLKRIIEIDSESRSGKWYETMCKNFERSEKLNRVLKDENDNINKGNN